MQNDDKRPGQPPIHTQLPDSIPDKDAQKIVGDRVPHSNDYNDPPPQGASKSTGKAIDDNVGGAGLGVAPGAHDTTKRVQDTRAEDLHLSAQSDAQKGNRQQGRQSSSQSSSQSAIPGNLQRGTHDRSEGLLPRGGETDGRYEVAEEVSLDQQSDRARKVGSMEEAAKGPHGDKLAEAVAGSLGKGDKGSGNR